MRRSVFKSAVLIAAIVALDQLVKYWAATTVRAAGALPLIDGVFEFVYTENRGAAFSILQGQRWFFIVSTLVMIGLMIWLLLRRHMRNRWGRLGVLFVIGGALGNYVDRLRLGYVIDMFYFKLINFAVFNVADVFIVGGGIMCIIYFLFMDDKLRKVESNGGQNT